MRCNSVPVGWGAGIRRGRQGAPRDAKAWVYKPGLSQRPDHLKLVPEYIWKCGAGRCCCSAWKGKEACRPLCLYTCNLPCTVENGMNNEDIRFLINLMKQHIQKPLIMTYSTAYFFTMGPTAYPASTFIAAAGPTWCVWVHVQYCVGQLTVWAGLFIVCLAAPLCFLDAPQ